MRKRQIIFDETVEKPTLEESKSAFKDAVEVIQFDAFKPGLYYKHFKSGRVYRLLAGGKMEKDGKKVALYQCEKSKEIWVRPIQEFITRFDYHPVDLSTEIKDKDAKEESGNNG